MKSTYLSNYVMKTLFASLEYARISSISASSPSFANTAICSITCGKHGSQISTGRSCLCTTSLWVYRICIHEDQRFWLGAHTATRKRNNAYTVWHAELPPNFGLLPRVTLRRSAQYMRAD
ncbi:hypothetical protein BC938DRAFT_472204 [Jimgerdemannia flammicorona]|uniref:Uncharacterized protein n=1 Tax=Jimgerdemannia flammicorona TaxID=994334 RepID=A0A433Q6M2_9FUNG|nr:hypothetical protein BC938DRAFT_472204 [Jimgerdemannia flammicorona]